MMAAGYQGLFERTAGSWRSVPVDAALRAENVWKVASTPDGGTWMVVTNQTSLTWRVVPSAIAIGMLLLIGTVALRRREKRIGGPV